MQDIFEMPVFTKSTCNTGKLLITYFVSGIRHLASSFSAHIIKKR
jgi:hypothetical protein